MKKNTVSLFFYVFCSNLFLFINSQYLNLENLENDLDVLFGVKIDYIYIFLISSLLISTTYITSDWFFRRISNINIQIQYEAIYSTIVYIGSLAIYLTIFRIIGVSRLILLITVFIIFLVNIITYSKYIKPIFNLIVSFIFLFLMLFNLNKESFNSEYEQEKNIQYSLTEESSIIEQETVLKNEIEEYLNFSKNFKTSYLGNFVLESKYSIEKYTLCCEEYSFKNFGNKAIGYVSRDEDNLFYISGNGHVFYSPLNKIVDGPNFKNLKTNFKELNLNKKIYTLSHDSVKDLLIHDNKILVSFVNEKSIDCVNVEVLIAEINYKELIFEKLFEYDECTSRNHPRFNSHAAGGKLALIDNENILLTIGDFLNYGKAQEDDSYFGKIVNISLRSSQSTIISKGHRNPQGLTAAYETNYFIETEHGPKGGDEINLININSFDNFGWPISSKGEHYDLEYKSLYGDVAPLNFSHSDFGFKEPLHYFPYHLVGPHGISDIEKNLLKAEETYFVTTLNGRVIYEVEINLQDFTLDIVDTFKTSERIRDIEYIKELNIFVILFEETPSIGFMSLNR